MGQLKVTLVKSTIGKTKVQRDSVRGLGLKKPHDIAIVNDAPAVRGLINKVSHMVTVEEIKG